MTLGEEQILRFTASETFTKEEIVSTLHLPPDAQLRVSLSSEAQV